MPGRHKDVNLKSKQTSKSDSANNVASFTQKQSARRAQSVKTCNLSTACLKRAKTNGNE